MNEELEEKPSYMPFIVVSIVFLLSATITDLMVFGFWKANTFPTILPKLNLLLMVGVIISSLKIPFNTGIVLALMVEVLLLVPSIFLVFNVMLTGKMNIDFFRTFTE
jgi:hypothetical protein